MLFFVGHAVSLTDITKIGYGLPHGINSFFEQGCSGLQAIIYLQSVWSMLFNAFLLTFVYNRLGRSENRSIQVIFSEKALVTIVDRQARFQFRVYDADSKHPVVEARIRMYCIMKDRPVPRPLRILQPDDTLGAMLLLSFPSVVSHHIDTYSVLHPPVPTMLLRPNGLVLREVDGMTLSRDDVVCPICGESFGTFEQWLDHVRYQQSLERADNFPVDNTHLSLDLVEIENTLHSKRTNNVETLKEYFKENVSEILCMVEGLDPLQSGNFQAHQSYRFEDIHWETYAQFAPCLSIEEVGSSRNARASFSVDLDRFHSIVPDVEAKEAARREHDEDLTEVVEIKTDVTEPNGSMKSAKKRHPRMKSLSSDVSDTLFSPTTQMARRKFTQRASKIVTV